jgi:hypothetical protein
MARIKARTKPKVKRTANKPVKAGQSMPRNIGGIANAKVVAIVRKKNG